MSPCSILILTSALLSYITSQNQTKIKIKLDILFNPTSYGNLNPDIMVYKQTLKSGSSYLLLLIPRYNEKKLITRLNSRSLKASFEFDQQAPSDIAPIEINIGKLDFLLLKTTSGDFDKLSLSLSGNSLEEFEYSLGNIPSSPQNEMREFSLDLFLTVSPNRDLFNVYKLIKNEDHTLFGDFRIISDIIELKSEKIEWPGNSDFNNSYFKRQLNTQVFESYVVPPVLLRKRGVLEGERGYFYDYNVDCLVDEDDHFFIGDNIYDRFKYVGDELDGDEIIASLKNMMPGISGGNYLELGSDNSAEEDYFIGDGVDSGVSDDIVEDGNKDKGSSFSKFMIILFIVVILIGCLGGVYVVLRSK